MSKGIDIPIDNLIADFTSYLWTTKTRQFYGRIFRNSRNGKIQPVYYSGNQGIDVLKDSKKDAQCFADATDDRKMFSDIVEAEVRILFMVNLSTLYPSLSRPDAIEQVMEDVVTVLMLSQFNLVKMVSGEDSFSDYKWSEDALSDLQSHHLFRFDLKTVYTNL